MGGIDARMQLAPRSERPARTERAYSIRSGLIPGVQLVLLVAITCALACVLIGAVSAVALLQLGTWGS
jgi:hypothetical protein